MRKVVVLDSNLIVSAFLNPKGAAAKALQIGIEHFELACSRETLSELFDVLTRDKFDKYLSKAERMGRLEIYTQSVIFYNVIRNVTDCKDPKDNKFLSLALAAKAVLIVSGDKRDLLCMHPFGDTAILSLRDFIDGFQNYVT